MTQCKNLTITSGAGTGALSVTAITGPASVTTGGTATFTATVTNTGTANGSISVNFIEQISGTLIYTQGTGTISPGGSQNISTNIDTSTWAIGNFRVCAKTSSETTYAKCKDFSITSVTGTGALSVTAIIGPPSVTKGEIATFIATVTNTGSASDSIGVTFSEEIAGTLISMQGTSMVGPGATQDLHVDINTSGWAIGNFRVCAKTSSETVYTQCKAFEIKSGSLPPPATEAGMSPILIGALAIGALAMMMSKKK